MTREVAVVAHTHWDREWYEPFEAFRERLVGVVDDLLAMLEDDVSYRRFLLDGQVVVVDDYLTARPESEARLRRLSGDGRLSIGPWYVLMDEFCVSGETIVRNLQLGLRRSAELAGGEGAMAVGYLPDMFGHVAQMPQILDQAGLAHAVVWRGVPASVDRTAFWWSAPDGTTVRAEYLPVGYANGAFLPGDPDALIHRLEAHEVELSAYLPEPTTPILLMAGSDHQPPRPELPAVLAKANEAQNHFSLRQVSLPEYLASAPSSGLPAVTGELRSGARANVLMGVLSNRIDIKSAAARVEREVERLAEPLALLWLPAGEWPARPLADAWVAMIHNSAHDSICACSADEVGRAVLHRYDTAASLAGVIKKRALDIASVATKAAGPLVINPGPIDADGVVEVVLPGIVPPDHAQVVSTCMPGVETRSGVGADLSRLLGGLTADGWLIDGRPTDAEILDGPDGLELRLVTDAARRPEPGVASVMADAWARAGAHRRDRLRVRVERRPSQVVASIASAVPGYGWARWRPTPLGGKAVAGGPGWLENPLVRVEVDEHAGTFSLNGRIGLDLLVDGGDAGDTYNYTPPASDSLVRDANFVAVELIEPGPVRGRLRITRRFTWPSEVEAGRRVRRQDVEVVTELELRAGEPLVRVTTSFANPCRDHRLRAHFPLPERADYSVAECAFGTVTRHSAEGGPHEPALATFPSRRFVQAGGLTITHDGLLEYELVEDGRALALTILRATGMLSRPAPAGRPNIAGPGQALEGPQMLGPHRVRFAVALGDLDPWRLADLAWLPLQVVQATGGGPLDDVGSRLRVSGAEVSALHRIDGQIEVRVFNPSAEPTVIRIPDHAGWLVDLTGRALDRWEGSFHLRPRGIATARLDATTLDP